ncbi:hypothetical protein IMCC12053_1542 [Celeribacter marinus]|uniref:Uncharacterized protein n=1 Tax=Celeribacter marinus TaxID=1397108 RepID=A0A0P0AA38_9RHOB|nr:hypothetical protein IMCC12053_1542 [Celeribacter marinus]
MTSSNSGLVMAFPYLGFHHVSAHSPTEKTTIFELGYCVT